MTSEPSVTPVLVRGYRLTRTVVHLLEGLATTAILFPFAAHASRQRMIQRWSQRLLRILAVELEHSGVPADFDGPVLIVANHVSWLDIFVVNALRPSRFIAMSEIKRWPVIGLLVAGAGTLFVDRTRRRDAARINTQVHQALRAGDAIALFPEGRTTFGRELLPFHGSLLQPVIDARGYVVPAAIRYMHLDGSHSTAAAYVGETTLLEAVRGLLRARRTRVRLHLCDPFPASGRHRREVAAEAHRIIRTALELPEAATEPGTPAGPPA
ncbi:MAG: lysophospholipid acyltransferase family protein [Betaproteobacteria bacterium]